MRRPSSLGAVLFVVVVMCWLRALFGHLNEADVPDFVSIGVCPVYISSCLHHLWEEVRRHSDNPRDESRIHMLTQLMNDTDMVYRES